MEVSFGFWKQLGGAEGISGNGCAGGGFQLMWVSGFDKWQVAVEVNLMLSQGLIAVGFR